MNFIIAPSLKTLEKTQHLLDNLNDETLCDTSISPYHSSIGSHVRHVLDFYTCIFNMTSDNKIDLTARTRNKDVESKCCNAKTYLNTIIEKLKTVDFDANETVLVSDDLGTGTIEMPYTLAAVFSQANSHTIHHYAIINYILEGLQVTLFKDADFGYNPTTPKANVLN